jgi:hypothetical protein
MAKNVGAAKGSGAKLSGKGSGPQPQGPGYFPPGGRPSTVPFGKSGGGKGNLGPKTPAGQ